MLSLSSIAFQCEGLKNVFYEHLNATFLDTLVQLLINKISNQPNTWRILNACRHIHGQGDHLKLKVSIRIRKKGDLSEFDSDMFVGATRRSEAFRNC